MPSCPICNKVYERESAYQKHLIRCKLIPPKPKSNNNEELPSYYEVCYLLKQSLLKISDLEKKIELHDVIINTKKKKVGVFEWLNTNIKPSLNYADWVKTIQVKKSQFEYLFDNSIVETVYHIVSSAISANPVIPFYAFGKTQTFYVYTSDTWLIAEVPSFTKLFKRVETELWKYLTEWKKKNEVEIVENQMMTEKYQKTVAKLTDISYIPNDVYNKMKTKIYNSIKMDIKSIVEEEIDF
jgi:uncharacterized protein YeeX (DUF496 family)